MTVVPGALVDVGSPASVVEERNVLDMVDMGSTGCAGLKAEGA